MRILAFILAVLMMLTAFVGCAKIDNTPSDKDNEKNEAVSDKVNTDEKENSSEDSDKSPETTFPPLDSDTKKDEESTAAPDKNDDSDKNDKTESTSDTKDTQKPENTDKKDPDTTDKEQISTEKNEDPKETVEDSDSGLYTDGIVLEAYLALIGSHFNKNYSIGDSLKKTDVLHLTALFILTQRSDTVGEVKNDEESFSLTKDQLESTMKILFGEKAKLSEQEKYLDEKKGDKKDGDTYIFSRNREDWGDKGYYLSYDHDMKIDENDNTFTAKVTLINGEGKTVNITYTLKKTVKNGYLYVQLTKAKTK